MPPLFRWRCRLPALTRVDLGHGARVVGGHPDLPVADVDAHGLSRDRYRLADHLAGVLVEPHDVVRLRVRHPGEALAERDALRLLAHRDRLLLVPLTAQVDAGDRVVVLVRHPQRLVAEGDLDRVVAHRDRGRHAAVDYALDRTALVVHDPGGRAARHDAAQDAADP